MDVAIWFRDCAWREGLWGVSLFDPEEANVWELMLLLLFLFGVVCGKGLFEIVNPLFVLADAITAYVRQWEKFSTLQMLLGLH